MNADCPVVRDLGRAVLSSTCPPKFQRRRKPAGGELVEPVNGLGPSDFDLGLCDLRTFLLPLSRPLQLKLPLQLSSFSVHER